MCPHPSFHFKGKHAHLIARHEEKKKREKHPSLVNGPNFSHFHVNPQQVVIHIFLRTLVSLGFLVFTDLCDIFMWNCFSCWSSQ